MQKRTAILFLLLAASLALPGAAGAAALSHAFTYQGQLTQSGLAVDGTVSMRFTLWNDPGTGTPPSGGLLVGAAQRIASVTVTGGVFTVALNANDEFGPNAFNGDARWLQIEVCTDTNCTSAVVLGPRQPLTGTPYSLGPWQTSGGNLVYSGGNVGIGTSTPVHSLHIKQAAPAVILEDTVTPANQSGYLAFWNGLAETAWMGFGTAGSPVFSIVNARSGGDIVLWSSGERVRVTSTGSVGIGTSTPASKLEVRGDVRVGALGEYFVPAGSENMRIIRGKVSSTGAVAFGSGFTVVHSATGVYSITYSTAFPSGQWPVITASAESNGSVARFAMINTPTNISATIRIVNGSGTAADADFYFIAVGTR